MNQELAGLLQRSARGDVKAFLWFYDSAYRRAFALEAARARVRGADGAQARAEAAAATEARFVEAWRRAGHFESSGLSPLAWLLSLPVQGVASALGLTLDEGGVVCA